MVSWIIGQETTAFFYIFLLVLGKLLANWVKNAYGFCFTSVTKDNSAFSRLIGKHCKDCPVLLLGNSLAPKTANFQRPKQLSVDLLLKIRL